jgi:hypothetical protein
MADASVRGIVTSRGASLITISRELAGMDTGKVTGIFRRRLEEAARPYPARVRASALAIPVKGPRHTGLRARIALCAETSSLVDGNKVYERVWINPERMRPDYMTLPLYMEGVAGTGRRRYDRWRHPVFGNRDVWAQQAAHPYFYQAAAPFGAAAEVALRVALDDITRQISG